MQCLFGKNVYNRTWTPFFLINSYNQMDLSTLDISLFCKLSQLFIQVKFDLSTHKVQPKTYDFKFFASVIWILWAP